MSEAEILAKMDPEYRELVLFLKAEVAKSGCSIRVLDPEFADERNKELRRRDQELLDKKLATPEQIQRKNSIFGPGEVLTAKFLSYGELDVRRRE